MVLPLKGNLVENSITEQPVGAEYNNARCSIMTNEPIIGGAVIKYIKFTDFETLKLYFSEDSDTYKAVKGIYSANINSVLSRINGNMLFIVPYKYKNAVAGTITTTGFEDRFIITTTQTINEGEEGEQTITSTTYSFANKKGYLTIQHLDSEGNVISTYKNYISFNETQGQSMEKVVNTLNKTDFDCDFELTTIENKKEVKITDHSYGTNTTFKVIATTLTPEEVANGYVDFASTSYLGLIDKVSTGGEEGSGENPVEILNRYQDDKDDNGNKAFYTYHFTTIAKMSASNLLELKRQIAENNLIETNTRYNFVKVHQSVADSVKLKDSKDLTFSLLFSYNPIFDSGVILSFVLGRKVSEESTYSLSFHNPYNSSLEPSAIKTIGQTSATILTNNNFEYIGYFDLNAGWIVKGKEEGSQSEDNANIQDFYYRSIPVCVNYAQSVGGLYKTMQTIKNVEILLYNFASNYKINNVIGAVPEEKLVGIQQKIIDSIQSKGVYFEMPTKLPSENILSYNTYLGLNGKFVKFKNNIVVFNS
jgi:hypothetical protein